MKINKDLITFTKSTSAVIFISALIGLSVKLFNGSFWASFILAASLQYILFTLFANIVNNYFAQQTKQKELDKLEQLSALLNCAYCKDPNVVVFLPDQNERVEFACDKCQGKNIVNINFTVARITEPLITTPSLQNAVITSEI